MKKNILFVAMASLVLATSCTEDNEIASTLSQQEIKVQANVSNVVSRATETTTDNLKEFLLYAYQDAGKDNYMDGVTYTNASGNWKTNQGTFYWPASGDLNFYALSTDYSGYFYFDSANQRLSSFSPKSLPENQVDLIYAKATGNLADNGSDGINLTFNHALSEIKVLAKNDNKAFTVEVSGVKVGNVISKGDFYLGEPGYSSYWRGYNGSGTSYEQTWTTPITIGENSNAIDVSDNQTFMLIPQQLEEDDNPSEGSYIALKTKITMQGGNVIHNDWVYVGVSTLWEMGNCYTYTVDFTTGIGKDENGNAYISNKRANYSVNVKPWNGETESLPRFFIKGENTNSDAFTTSIDGNDISITPAEDGTWKYEVTGKHPASLYGAFNGNTSLKTINVKGMDVSEVTDMTAMFQGCSSLKTIDLSRWDTSNVKSIGFLFNQCSSLETVDLSGWNLNNLSTSSITDYNWVFSGCTDLKTIYMVGCNSATIERIKQAVTQAGLSTDIVKTTR